MSCLLYGSGALRLVDDVISETPINPFFLVMVGVVCRKPGLRPCPLYRFAGTQSITVNKKKDTETLTLYFLGFSKEHSSTQKACNVGSCVTLTWPQTLDRTGLDWIGLDRIGLD